MYSVHCLDGILKCFAVNTITDECKMLACSVGNLWKLRRCHYSIAQLQLSTVLCVV